MSLKVNQTGTIRKLGCGFLFTFYSNCGSILHNFRDKTSYWSKIVIFSYPLAFDAPIRGSRQNIAIPFGIENYNGGASGRWKNFEDTYNRLDRIPASDRQTDRQTSCHGIVRVCIVRAMHTRRAVKICTARHSTHTGPLDLLIWSVLRINRTILWDGRTHQPIHCLTRPKTVPACPPVVSNPRFQGHAILWRWISEKRYEIPT